MSLFKPVKNLKPDEWVVIFPNEKSRVIRSIKEIKNSDYIGLDFNNNDHLTVHKDQLIQFL